MMRLQEEHELGRYRVRFARFDRGRWQSYGPWMEAFITDRRFLVCPDRGTPMTILPRSIMRVWRVCLGKRDGGILLLRNGTLLYFYVDWSQGAKLVKDLQHMAGYAAAV